MPASSPLRKNIKTAAFLAVLAVSLLLIAATFSPLAIPIMFGAILAAATHGVSSKLSRRLGDRPHLAATIMTMGLVLAVLIPVGGAVVVVVGDAIEAGQYVAAALEKGGFDELIGRLPESIEEPMRNIARTLSIDEKSITRELRSTGGALAGAAAGAAAAVGGAAFDLVLILVAYASMLLYGPVLLRWLEANSPLGRTNTAELLERFKNTSTAVLGSTVLSAAAQAVVATVGYLIASVPSAAFLGFLTGLAAMLPAIGSALVTVPVAVLLLAAGHTWEGVFVGMYGLLVVSMVDNVIKPLFIKGRAQMNGTVVLFSLLGGMIAFGASGLVIGPLSVTFFQSMLEFTRREIASDTDGASPPSAAPTPTTDTRA